MNTYKSRYSYQHNNRQPYDYSYIAPVVFKILSNRGELRILELGCSNGYLSNALSKMGNKVVGIDASESGIESADKSYPGVRFIKSDIYDLLSNNLINEDSFDVVVAIEVIEHLQYPRELIRVARRYLKRGGQLIISTPYHGYFKNIAISLFNKWDDHFGVSWDVGHVKFFSVKTLKKMLEEEYFNDIRFRYAGRLPMFWKSMVCICNNSRLF